MFSLIKVMFVCLPDSHTLNCLGGFVEYLGDIIAGQERGRRTSRTPNKMDGHLGGRSVV